jgi:hypothetical protein
MIHRSRSVLKALAGEPLLRFLAIGIVLFAAYAWRQRGAPGERAAGSREIRIGATQVEWLAQTWARQWQRPPTEEEIKGLVADYLKEELLSREARELGLDVGDTIVRRRLAQKMEFLVEDTTKGAEPTGRELRQIFDANRERFQRSARVSFTHVFFDRTRHGEKVVALVQQALAVLSSEAPPDVSELGDPSLLSGHFESEDERAVTSQLGAGFARAVFALEPGRWQGPIESSYGTHLVRVGAKQPAKAQTFEEARDAVIALWRERRERSAREEYFAKLLEKYDVAVDEDVKALLGPMQIGKASGR